MSTHRIVAIAVLFMLALINAIYAAALRISGGEGRARAHFILATVCMLVVSFSVNWGSL